MERCEKRGCVMDKSVFVEIWNDHALEALRLLREYYYEKYPDSVIIHEALICLAEEKKLMESGSEYRKVEICIDADGKTRKLE